MGAVLDEVVGPHAIAILWPQPDARSVGQPDPAALGLLVRNFQPLASPDPLHPLVVDPPACLPQQGGDLAIAVATVLPGQFDGVGRQPFFIVTSAGDLALVRAVLSERNARGGDESGRAGPQTCRWPCAQARAAAQT